MSEQGEVETLDVPRVYTLAEAGKHLSLSAEYLRQMAQQGKVKSIKFGRRIRIPHDELIRLSTEGLG